MKQRHEQEHVYRPDTRIITLIRVVEFIERFAFGPSAADLMAYTSLSRATIYSHLSLLLDNRYITKTDITGIQPTEEGLALVNALRAKGVAA